MFRSYFELFISSQGGGSPPTCPESKKIDSSTIFSKILSLLVASELRNILKSKKGQLTLLWMVAI
jgi:hypothetical protein